MTIGPFETRYVAGELSGPDVFVLEVRPRLTPQDDPLAWLVVERVEHFELYPDGSRRAGSLELRYEELVPHGPRAAAKGVFQAGWRAGHGAGDVVSLTSGSCDYSGGYVLVEEPRLRGHRIGTYFLSQVAAWVKQWPDASVIPVRLNDSHAGADNKTRRNRVYEQLQLVFDFDDESTRAAGQSRPMPAAALRVVNTWQQNLKVVDVREHIAGLLRQAADMQMRSRWLQRDHAEMDAQLAAARRHPIFWALCQTWENLTFRLKY